MAVTKIAMKTLKTGFQEERRELIDYPGYFVTPTGRVFNAAGEERPQYLSGVPEYRYVSLPANNAKGWQIRRVHILVAKAYIPNPENLPMINHKNEDKMDCTVGNLEWCTRQHNVLHSIGSRKDMKGIPSPRYDEEFQKEVVQFYVREVNRGRRSKRAVYSKFGISPVAFNAWIKKHM